MPDRIHMCISIPPKYSAPHAVGFINGKSAIAIARQLGREGNLTGKSFRARGYFVSTVGLDEERVRAYIRDQNMENARHDQLKLAM